jgi:hypothetical protein
MSVGGLSQQTIPIKRNRKMDKKEYMKPEQAVIVLSTQNAVLISYSDPEQEFHNEDGPGE